ncbi:hypothetical protein ACVXG7_01495 [Enterobacter hormaechei]
MGRRGGGAPVEGGWNKGGKGPSICDVLTGGAHGVPREITQEVIEGKSTRTTKPSTSMAITKKTLSCLPRWASNVSVPPSPGRASSRKATKLSRTKRG